MNYKFTSLKPMLDLFKEEWALSAWKVSQKLWISRTITHKYLKALVAQGKIIKEWKSPYTVYKIWRAMENTWGKKKLKKQKEVIHLDYKTIKLGEEIFFKFSPKWDILRGIKWMQKWCDERDMFFKRTLKEYIQIYEYIESQRDKCGMLDAWEAFWKHFTENSLKEVFYADQYIYSQFGRWKLAEMAFYAKQSQNKALITETISEIFPKLECLIINNGFHAIAMTPWSVKRENQILSALKNELLQLNIPFINIIKYSPSWILIPQKSLKKPEDRIENAKSTIFIDDKHVWNYKKVLLIDDFVGSWATLNETAKKLKDEWVQVVYGFAFVWNTNLNYEVINEI